jgi:hypothetical protein
MIVLTMQPGAVTWRTDRAVNLVNAAVPSALESACRSYVKSVQKQTASQIPSAKSTVGRYKLEELHKSTSMEPRGDVAYAVFNPHIYARLREKGGVVTPKNRKLLALPMNYAAETLQLSIRNPDPTDPVVNSLYHSPAPLIFVKRRDGKMFLLPKESSHGLTAGLPAYSLHEYTIHMPHPFMAPAMTEGYPEALAAFAEKMRETLGRAT